MGPFKPKYSLATVGPHCHRLTVTPPPMSGFPGSSILLNDDQVNRFLNWQRNPLLMIQDVFPDLNADEREIILSGIGPEQWDKAFKDE